MADDSIKKLSDINENLAPPGYSLQQRDDHVKFFKLVNNEMLLPEVTECIRIDKELHVKLFFKGSPVLLPQWFRHGRDCCLTHKSMLENFPAYLLSLTENFDSIFEEFCEYKFKKRPVYYASVTDSRYYYDTLLYSHTGFLQKNFPLSSIPLLKNICSGAIDAVRYAQTLKNKGKISEDVCLLFNEIYLKKFKEYFGGDLIGCGEDGNLYKGLVCFMNVGFKESVPYVIKSSPQTGTSADWLKSEVLECLYVLIKMWFLYESHNL